jgi:phage repressor protein C with HTH and peptisase S24 domain
MFVSQVFGKSMEPDISSGSYCIFRTPVVGSRMNKIVLVQHNSIADVENGGRYTVKRYMSKKKISGDETWEHEQISLLPINPAYKPIVISNPEDGNFMVIAEFVKVLGV